jgi:hypothetical protein
MYDLSTLITKHPNKEIVIGGDFNVKFANKSHAKHQRILLTSAAKHNLLNVLGPVPEVDVMAKRPQGLLNVGTLSVRMAVLRSCALDI